MKNKYGNYGGHGGGSSGAAAPPASSGMDGNGDGPPGAAAPSVSGVDGIGDGPPGAAAPSSVSGVDGIGDGPLLYIEDDGDTASAPVIYTLRNSAIIVYGNGDVTQRGNFKALVRKMGREGTFCMLVIDLDDLPPDDDRQKYRQYMGDTRISTTSLPEPSTIPSSRALSNPQLDSRAALGQWRLKMIFPALENMHGFASNAAYFRNLAEKEHVLPDGSRKTFGAKTFQKWLELYKKGGFDSLMPAEHRSDLGTSRILPDETADKIVHLMEERPRINGKQIYMELRKNGEIPPSTHLTTIQRYIKTNSLRPGNGKEETDKENDKGRLAFEYPAFGQLWQTDTCKLMLIDGEIGVPLWAYVIGIIDDHSRCLVGIDAFYEDNAINFQSVFKQAVLQYGIPAKLYTDNGSPYANAQLKMICGSLGTVLLHAPVRDGSAKGKVERMWRTFQSDLVMECKPGEVHGLEQMRTIARNLANKYNMRPHSSIKCRPCDRIHDCTDSYHIKIPESTEWVNECFDNRVSRKIRNDHTISISNVMFQVPVSFKAGTTVEVRYHPTHMEDSAYIYRNGVHYPITVVDKNANARTRRGTKRSAKETPQGRQSTAPELNTGNTLDFSTMFPS